MGLLSAWKAERAKRLARRDDHEHRQAAPSSCCRCGCSDPERVATEVETWPPEHDGPPPILEGPTQPHITLPITPVERDGWVDCVWHWVDPKTGEAHDVPLRHPKDPTQWSGDLTTMEHTCGIKWVGK